jgi:hypothetical protein
VAVIDSSMDHVVYIKVNAREAEMIGGEKVNVNDML